MNRFLILFAILWSMCFSAYSQASGLADLKFGQYQIADSQWNVSACMYSSTCEIYSKNPGIAYQIPWYSGQIQWTAGDYIRFQAWTPDPNNPWVAIQYAADGTQKAVMGTGHIINMGTDYFFFVGNDNNTGQLFSMTQGFANTSGVTWTGTLNPTVSQVNTYAQGGSTTPLAAGQTAQPTAPPPPQYPSYVTVGSGTAGTMEFGTSANITTSQQTRVNIWTNKTIPNGNSIYIDQVGDNNSLTVLQEGNKNLIKGIGVDLAKIEGDGNNITFRQGVTGVGKNEINFSVIGDTNTLNINQARDTQGTAVGGNGHYQSVDINGYSNTLTTQQSNAGGVGGHYMETTISGNSNNIVSKQTENGNKIMFTNVSGNSNTIDARQKDTGQHYLDIKMTGNNNNATVLQEGTTANRATLDLTNAGGPANVTVQQNGGQSVSVTTTCATAGGCAPITVRQGY